MKLRKDQRYTLYCILLEEAEKDYPYYVYGYPISSKLNGFCWMYRLITGSDELYWGGEFMIPELYKKRTVNTFDGFYFKNWRQRIKALKQCIKETENF